MQLLKKLLTYIFCFIFSIFLASCANDSNLANNSNFSNTTRKVAIILPLFDKYSVMDLDNIQKEMEIMIKLAIAGTAKSKVTTLSFFPKNIDELKEATIICNERNVDIIIGPIFSENTKFIAKNIRNKRTPIISFSNDPAIAGNNVIVFGHMPVKQLQFALQSTLDNGYENIIMLLPAGRHAKSISEILQEQIMASNATLVRVEYYNNSKEDMKRAAKIVSDNIISLETNDENSKTAVIVADDHKTLKALSNILASHNLGSRSLIISDNRINNDSALKKYLYCGGDIQSSNELLKKSSLYGIKHLNLMHELSYDAGVLAMQILKLSADSNAYELKGISGDIKILDNLASRRYNIITQADGIKSYFNVEQDNASLTTQSLADLSK